MTTGTRGAHPTRQARRRAATYDEIVRAARTLLAEGQPLTLRGVAAEMGASPAGLYRYVAHLDELRDLVAAAIDQALAADVRNSVADFIDADAAGRWLTGWTALRRAALARPDEFRMLLARPRSQGAPIRALSDTCLGQLLHAMWQQHDFALPPVPPSVGTELAITADWPEAFDWLHARVCASLHGVIALEVTGYVEPAFVESGVLYRTTMLDWLARLGQVADLDRLLPVLDAELVR